MTFEEAQKLIDLAKGQQGVRHGAMNQAADMVDRRLAAISSAVGVNIKWQKHQADMRRAAIQDASSILSLQQRRYATRVMRHELRKATRAVELAERARERLIRHARALRVLLLPDGALELRDIVGAYAAAKWFMFRFDVYTSPKPFPLEARNPEFFRNWGGKPSEPWDGKPWGGELWYGEFVGGYSTAELILSMRAARVIPIGGTPAWAAVGDYVASLFESISPTADELKAAQEAKQATLTHWKIQELTKAVS